LLKRFSAPKAKIELKLSELGYESTDKLTGQIVLDPQEEIAIDEFRLEFNGTRITEWEKGFLSHSSFVNEQTRKITVGPPIKLSPSQHHEQPFQVDIPQFSRPDPFTDIVVRIKGVAIIQGRRALTNEVKVAINFPYVIECERRYGGCGFITQPMAKPIKVCPKCGNNLEEVWNRKYRGRALTKYTT